MQELIYMSAKKLAQAIREKKVSSQEVVQAYLQRIEQVNPKLNAVVQITGETALKQAKEADEQLARGETTGALHGVPMTIKDSFDTAGVVSTGGTFLTVLAHGHFLTVAGGADPSETLLDFTFAVFSGLARPLLG